MVCQRVTIAALAALLMVTACSGPSTEQPEEISANTADTDGAFPATGATRSLNAEHARDPALNDDEDWALVRRGFVARDDDLDIRDADGRSIWRPADYAFLDGEDTPDTVHPSLWRQARLNAEHGLYEVVPGIYQVRGYDLANMSIVEGETGRIIIDPLTSVETAQAALALIERELGPRPVSAVILTHSHIDHFGGVEAIEGALGEGPVPVIAPAVFLKKP